jgi:hypothetical protein
MRVRVGVAGFAEISDRAARVFGSYASWPAVADFRT